jgi:hypothetical protein
VADAPPEVVLYLGGLVVGTVVSTVTAVLVTQRMQRAPTAEAEAKARATADKAQATAEVEQLTAQLQAAEARADESWRQEVRGTLHGLTTGLAQLQVGHATHVERVGQLMGRVEAVEQRQDAQAKAHLQAQEAQAETHRQAIAGLRQEMHALLRGAGG